MPGNAWDAHQTTKQQQTPPAIRNWLNYTSQGQRNKPRPLEAGVRDRPVEGRTENGIHALALFYTAYALMKGLISLG